ncbi:MAG: glycosyltransferase family 4 protein, partial [Actinomycetota bacterium]
RRAVRAFEPDVIHGHDWLSRSVLPRVVSGSIPVVTSLHYYTRTCAKKTLWRDDEVCAGPSLRQCLRCAGDHYGSAKGAVVTLGLRAGAALEDRRSASYVSVSAATAEGNSLDHGPGSVPASVVVANPLAPGALQATNGAAVVPETIPDGPFVLFVGDLRPEKGIRVLLAAVERLRQQGCSVPLVLVGEKTSDGLEVPVDTIETGQVDHDVVQAIWRRATVGVVPSLWPEPFGLVAIEAMAAGCPLVASSVGGLAEILADDRGVLVPPGDPTALAGAIGDLLTDEPRRQTVAERAKASLERYDLDLIVDGIEAQYRAAIDGNRGR